jgi:hypothetical protein
MQPRWRPELDGLAFQLYLDGLEVNPNGHNAGLLELTGGETAQESGFAHASSANDSNFIAYRAIDCAHPGLPGS